MDPVARVSAVLRAAARIADPHDPLGIEARRRLPATSDLSPPNVDLALRRHLEIDLEAAPALVAWAEKNEPCPRTHLLLAANVCTGALRAIACAAAASPSVVVRPSRRDPVLSELLVAALEQAGHPFATLTPELDPAPGETVHVFGSDETVKAQRAQLPPGTLFWGHGHGFGVAHVDAAADLTLAARAFADDLVPFDGRGCLSPRVVIVEGGVARARAFAQAASTALTALAIPRGPLADDEAAALTRFRRTMAAIGEVFETDHHLLALDPAPEALALGPAARVATILPDASPLASVRRSITAVGHTGPAPTDLAPASARFTPLGRMQRPPLDGPVDRRARPERL
ncbi:MAG: acyl-CoA reductase [Polyangiaceae bacterium]